mmetsp:Transcript_121969/g.215884  ORF Transcript_121969/g.215884 Transcript_121969/m.215884 type:complete len:210 (-) Transcript_121969:1130-1759(-)
MHWDVPVLTLHPELGSWECAPDDDIPQVPQELLSRHVQCHGDAKDFQCTNKLLASLGLEAFDLCHDVGGSLDSKPTDRDAVLLVSGSQHVCDQVPDQNTPPLLCGAIRICRWQPAIQTISAGTFQYSNRHQLPEHHDFQRLQHLLRLHVSLYGKARLLVRLLELFRTQTPKMLVLRNRSYDNIWVANPLRLKTSRIPHLHALVHQKAIN